MTEDSMAFILACVLCAAVGFLAGRAWERIGHGN